MIFLINNFETVHDYDDISNIFSQCYDIFNSF